MISVTGCVRSKVTSESFKLMGGKMGCNGHVVVCVVGRGGREKMLVIFLLCLRNE